MRLSRERLQREAATTGFRVEILEKVAHLLELLDGFNRHPYMKGRLALKGGTALNLFVFDAPRLSIDIDVNYVGQLDREAMLAERPEVERALEAVCGRADIAVERAPGSHAGGKWRLRYESAEGQIASLELDINYMLRAPLWNPTPAVAKPVGTLPTPAFPILDIHELAAGKLAALLARQASPVRRAPPPAPAAASTRSGCESVRGLQRECPRKDWRTVSVDHSTFEPRELRNHLVPTLRPEPSTVAPIAWAQSLNDECRDALRVVLPLAEAESEFLDRLLDHGELVPALLKRPAARRAHRRPADARLEVIECPPAQGKQVVACGGDTDHRCAVGNPITRAFRFRFVRAQEFQTSRLPVVRSISNVCTWVLRQRWWSTLSAVSSVA